MEDFQLGVREVAKMTPALRQGIVTEQELRITKSVVLTVFPELWVNKRINMDTGDSVEVWEKMSPLME